MTRVIAPAVLILLAACSTTANDDPDPVAKAGPAEVADRVVYLRHVKAKDVVDALMGLQMPYQVTIQAGPEGDSVLIRGDETSVNQVLKVIETVDKPAR